MDQGKEVRFAVVLEAPLGLRTGRLTLSGTEGVCTGQLALLGACNLLSGRIDSGHCRFSGLLRTAMLNKPFEAEGTLTDREIDLALRFEFGVCRLHGIREGE